MSRGHDRERDVRKMLEEQGWFAARACGSLGDADIVACSAIETLSIVNCEPETRSLVRLIEVKSTSRPYERFGPDDRAALSAAARRAGARAWLVWWPLRGSPVWIPEGEWPTARSPHRKGAA